VAAALAGAGAASKLFQRKSPSIGRAIAELRASQPTGYLTPNDLRAAELTRGRITEGVNAQGAQAGAEIGRRFQARGLAGSPSEERSRARLEQQQLLGAENAGNTAEEQLYNLRTGREAYQHQNDLSIFGAQVGQANLESQRQQAQNGAFWNSINEFIPTITKGLAPTDTGGGGTPVPPQPGYTPVPPSGGFTPGAQPSP
jgi:hypothetical protein